MSTTPAAPVRLPRFEKHMAFLLGGPKPRRTPATPYRFVNESGDVLAYRVTWRHGFRSTIGTLIKRDGAWHATAQIDGPGWDNPPRATFRTRAAAAEWLMVVTNVPNN